MPFHPPPVQVTLRLTGRHGTDYAPVAAFNMERTRAIVVSPFGFGVAVKDDDGWRIAACASPSAARAKAIAAWETP